MQTDILYRQLITKLSDLKIAIERFEKHTSPSTTYTEELYRAIIEANKLTSAYAILKEQKDVSPDLNLHLKLMNVEKQAEAKNAALEHEKEKTIVVEQQISAKPVFEQLVVITDPVPEKIIEQPLQTVKTEQIEEEKNQTISDNTTSTGINYPKFTININDKFRIINELFLGNTTEYNIAIEQLNSLNSPSEATVYLRELKKIYNWNDESEMVKKVNQLIQKRFI